jgi:Tfp pilus assembly protein FimV
VLAVLALAAGWLDDRPSVPSAAAAPAGPIEVTPGGGPAGPQVYVVQPGDTLWSIARRLDPAGDVRSTVDELVSRHGSATVDVGDRIPLDGLAAPP